MQRTSAGGAGSVRPPGEYIREALTERGWTQDDLARVIGRPLPTVNEIIQGKRSIMPEMAVALGLAFGTSPDVWMQRESAWRLSQVRVDGSDVQRRARLYDLAPIKDLVRRGWIRATDDPEELEGEVLRFFGIKSLDEKPSLSVLPRKSDSDAELTPAQLAWCFRARALASEQVVAPFDPARFDECLAKLRPLAAFVTEARKVPSVLAKFGIRFVIVEPLPGARIDGAAFWVGPDRPAIAMSIRFDRIDAFWFTLCHELSHIRHADPLSIDTALVGEDAEPTIAKVSFERRADDEAATTLIPADKITSFIHRVAPLYSKERIIQFAHRIKIHPGIIVGQLQHRGEIGFHANREMLAKVREKVVPEAIVDGWGHSTK